MIRIEAFRNAAREITGFHICGHSNIAPKGQDIVCAAVSALAQTAALGLGEYLDRDFRLEIKPGLLRVDLEGKPDALTGAILETMLLGLREIARGNPESVGITE